MTASERFYRTLDKLAGRGEGLELSVEAVRGAFEQALGRMPDELCQSIFLRFLDGFNHSGKAETDFVDAAYSLGSYIDLFWMDYDGGEHPLSDRDWVFLREEISACAGDLDLDILAYIMQQIMTHGGL